MVNAKHIPALLLLLAATLVSCVYDDAPALRSDDGRQAVQVTFTLAAGNAPTDTRAEGPTWGDVYPNENGTAWESAIAPDDLQVLLYTTADNGYVGRVENLVSFRNDDGTSYTYHGQLTADSDDLTSGTEYKIMVFANCGIDNNTEDISSIANKTFAQDARYIPLWGVKTTTLNLTPGTADNLGDIDLLRAMAKVEVTLSDALTGEYTLSRVTLNRYNQTGYCLPAGYATAPQTTDLDREDGTAPISFNPKASVPSSPSPIGFQIENGRAVCYLPEYEADDTNPAVLTITLNGKAYTLDLKDYNTDNGGYYDLVRNHIYRYTITGVNEGTLTVQYRVQPWELVSTETGWPGEHNFYQLLPSGGENEDYQEGDADAVYGVLSYPRYADGEGNTVLRSGRPGARFQFTLSKPDGVVWTAHLSNTEDFEFSYSDDNGQHMVSTGISRNEPYYIQINPRHPWTVWPEGEEESTDFDAPLSEYGQRWETEHIVPSTYFYVTASLDGEHEVELNINPPLSSDTDNNSLYTYDGHSRRFPGTGTRIWIRQLRAVEGQGFGYLARDVDPTSPDFEWWRVNPYWK